MLLVGVLLATFLMFSAVIVLVPVRFKALAAIAGVLVCAGTTAVPAVSALMGNSYGTIINGGLVFGSVRVEVDALSAWFLLLMNFTMITSAVYGKGYMKAYPGNGATLSMHWISFMLNQAAMTLVYIVRNSLAFMAGWELIAISAFLLVIFEHGRMETLKAGINYLIQSHVSIVLLMIGFMWVAGAEGNYDFGSVTAYCGRAGQGAGVLLFIVFLMGFSLKAGFIPFHTWLPYAHPAAPAHVSGMMSGVMIKIGIYGIMRVMLLENANWVTIGTILLILGVLSGLYGVMLAIVQHNLKRLLAYHSIENIGIIGIGLGVGAIGAGNGNQLMAILGFSGALLHVLNHSLFKSLLFFGSGVVYQAIHTLNIDSMGGLVKKMPLTAGLFLLASLAICGLPPFNGFISEFLIYLGLFKALHTSSFEFAALFVLSIVGLVLIGGLAILCFTKAFGIVFSGTARSADVSHATDPGADRLIPMFSAAVLIVAIGLFPQVFLNALSAPVALFAPVPLLADITPVTGLMQNVSIAAWVFVVLVMVVWFVRRSSLRAAIPAEGPTWGCGWQAADARLQYTATSYVRSYRKLVEPLMIVERHRPAINTVVPPRGDFSTHTSDRVEYLFIDLPVRKMKSFIGRFNFLQNGSVQFYVLYGILFIFVMIAIPLIIGGLEYVVDLIKQL